MGEASDDHLVQVRHLLSELSQFPAQFIVVHRHAPSDVTARTRQQFDRTPGV